MQTSPGRERGGSTPPPTDRRPSAWSLLFPPRRTVASVEAEGRPFLGLPMELLGVGFGVVVVLALLALVAVVLVADALLGGPISLFRWACKRARARRTQPSEEPDCPLGEGRP